jgi:hypothetical protein
MKPSWLTAIALMAIQKSSTALSASAPLIIMPPKTRKTTGVDMPEARFNHIKEVWMRNFGFLDCALTQANITEYMDLVRLLEDPDAINALTTTEDDGRVMNININMSERLRSCLSLVNDLQLAHGPITTSGLVDITRTSVTSFDNYCMGRPPFVDYSEAKAIAAQKERIIKDAEVEADTANAAAAQARAQNKYKVNQLKNW